MAGIWYFQQNGQTIGPVSQTHVQQLIGEGKLAPTDMVRGDGMDDWVSVSSLSMQTTKPAVTPPPAPPPRPTAVPPKPARQPQNKNSAGLWFAAVVAIVLVSGGVGWLANSLLRPKTSHPQNNRQFASRTGTRTDNRPSSPLITPRSEDQASHDDQQKVFSNVARTDGFSEQSARNENKRGNLAASSRTEDTRETPASEPPTESSSQSKAQPKSSPTPEPKPTPIEEPVVLYQELHVARNPTFVIQGIPISQEIEYRVLSRLQLGPVGEDGMRKAEQTIEDTKLIKGDPLSRSAFETSLRDLIGQQFSFTLNKHHEVIKFTGHKDTKTTVSAKAPERDGFLVTSVMDEDGWKELAQFSFFLPKENAENGLWKRQITHDWGELGSWYGETTFTSDNQDQQPIQFRFSHDLKYLPPEKAATSSPLVINSAKFELQNGSGIIRFDSEAKRVAITEEKFHAKGELETKILGQAATVTLEEQQVLVIRLSDQNPWSQ